jgi:multidrug efflux system membrane fusion protein
VKHGVTVIPSAAVQRGAKGTFVYVVKDDQTVAVRMVALGTAHGENTSIDKGLSPDELVVVDGTEKLREGSKVEARNQNDKPATGPETSPAGSEKPRRGPRS